MEKDDGATSCERSCALARGAIAFPQIEEASPAISKRTLIAMHAMQALVAKGVSKKIPDNQKAEYIAKASFFLADEMLKEEASSERS